ncbi:innexin unc-9-like [Babylonia areolata]|uniref:innexin unc-9-like n=1 Tax=Babylonia areolata TaxID=304850 RepID=UPI003FD18945
MLDTAMTTFTNLALRAKIRNDDGIDQLHHFVTVAILAFFAAITGVVEYAGEPINCWNAGDLQWKHYQEHVNTYCWTHPLYHYPQESNPSIMPYRLNSLGVAENMSEAQGIDDSGKVTFFRWVTIIFLIQAFLFKVPNLMWSELNSYAGSNIIKMVEMLQSVLFATPKEKKEKLQQVALFLEQWLRIHRKPHWFLKADVSPMVKKTLSCCMVCVGNNLDNYLSTLYLVVKGLFLLNNLLQFLLLSAFLQLNFWHFGVKTLQAYDDIHIYQTNTKTFPIVSLCHFQTYSTDTSIGKWVQCILTINIFLEKLFLIEWFWLLVLLVMTSISFFVWCFRILQTKTSMTFVRRYMKLMYAYSEPLEVPSTCSVEQFVLEYLRNDGIFVLRILAVNTNEVVVAQLVEELWRRYLTFEESPHNISMGMAEAEAETSFNHPDIEDKAEEQPRV